MERIKKFVPVLEKGYNKSMFYLQTYLFKKRYKKINKELFKRTLDKATIREYKNKWKVLGESVEVDTFLLCYNLSGIIDLNIVPENLFAGIIERKLNQNKESSFFDVKNIHNKWFENKNIFPKVYLHKIDGLFYDEELKVISDLNKYLETIDISYPLILKPSKDTSGGVGVKTIDNIDDLLEGLKGYDYLVCQEMIVQHKELNKINNSGINSVRTCLYRTENGKFEVLNNSIRFGVDGGLDNLSAGGIVCNIDENGFLNNYALGKYADKHFEHPNSNVKFKDIKTPFYDELLLTAKNIADELILCNLISLDMCLDENNNWRCLETNMRGQTIRFVQYAGKGFFGEFTNEVIDRCIS